MAISKDPRIDGRLANLLYVGPFSHLMGTMLIVGTGTLKTALNNVFTNTVQDCILLISVCVTLGILL